MALRAAVVQAFCMFLALITANPKPFEHLDVLKVIFNHNGAHRPPIMIRKMHDEMVLNWTYNSNAMEGNTLTMEETELVLKGTPVEGKTQREHDEAINHYNGIMYIMGLLKSNDTFSEEMIKQLHRHLMRHINDKCAGVYRRVPAVHSRYVKHRPPPWALVPQQMKQFVTWHETEAKKIHVVERAARVNADIMKIYPFVEDNGRTARLLMNLEFLKKGYPPIMVPPRQRNRFLMALDVCHVTGQCDQYISLIVTFIENTFDEYYRVLNITAGEVLPLIRP